MSDDIISVMDEDQMQALLIEVRDKISFASPTPSIFVQYSNLFTSPFSLSSPAPTSFTVVNYFCLDPRQYQHHLKPQKWIVFVLLLLPLGL